MIIDKETLIDVINAISLDSDPPEEIDSIIDHNAFFSAKKIALSFSGKEHIKFAEEIMEAADLKYREGFFYINDDKLLAKRSMAISFYLNLFLSTVYVTWAKKTQL